MSVLEFRGKLTYCQESEHRYQELCAHLKRGSRCFLLDLEQVPDIDSTGIGFLVTCLTTVLRAGGKLYLVAPSDCVLKSLMITRLDHLFPAFESVDAALSTAGD